MKNILSILLYTFLMLSGIEAQEKYQGYFNFQYIDGKVLLDVNQLDKEFLYVNAIASGLGSNDLGLDRGKLGNSRVVKFIKRGGRLLLVQPNQKFRALSENARERRAVEQAFAQSILYGFKIEAVSGSTYTIDLSPFLLDDTNGVSDLLKKEKEGNYKLDKSRTVIDDMNLLAFPKNVEFESYLTFVGTATGKYLKSVSPTSSSITIKQHQSFIELPDDNYTPRRFHPYSGYFGMSYFDYATPIDQHLEQRFITRHRLEKKDVNALFSEAKEPIVYYVDGGCPEPILSALIDGALWWNQAFEAAGFKNAFQVKVLPEDAHPLDVRYNVIQWVHRSTRGWSYGDSVTDPRTGEIIKGHVSLGSLRVRQDFMLAQGLLSPYKTSEVDNTPMLKMALARLRQLSAHEVGHTLGLAHNFTASVNDRSSVMDYPHPLVLESTSGFIDLSNAYDDKIGEWDKGAIRYGYSQFLEKEDEGLLNILKESKEKGLLYISDRDARPQGGAHPYAHLWDNGQDAVQELYRLMKLRKSALARFGDNTLQKETPFSELEKKLVPVYLMHRYQVEAVAKWIGGVNYNYAVKGFDELRNSEVSEEDQSKAIDALLSTLTEEALKLPDNILASIPPSAMGFAKSRESFSGHTGLVFDPVAPAEAYAGFVFGLMLHPDRLARLDNKSERLMDYLDLLRMRLFKMGLNVSVDINLVMIVQKAFVIRLIQLKQNEKASAQVRASATLALEDIYKQVNKNSLSAYSAHAVYVKQLIDGISQIGKKVKIPSLLKMPPGSPIGCGHMH